MDDLTLLYELLTKVKSGLVEGAKKDDKVDYYPLGKEQLHEIKVGDVVERMLAFRIPQYLLVTEVTDKLIVAGMWNFERETGLEYDPDIPMKVSYLRRVLTEEQKQLLTTQKEIPFEKPIP